MLLVIYRHQGTWCLPLVVRPDTMTNHAGQVSLPGGTLDLGETTTQCALREWEEELGAPREELEILGSLAPVWVFVSNFLVTPHVAVMAKRPAMSPNPAEVAEVIELPLDVLLETQALQCHQIVRGPLRFSAPCYSFGGYAIWGATCLILAELAARLGTNAK